MRKLSYILCVGSMAALAACGNSAPPSAVTNSHAVTITAGRFHFTPDRITLIKGQPVTLELASTDTTHGFMIRALKIDTDIKPGKITSITVTPLATGTFNAICDHYCGLGHGGMKMTVVVKDPTSARSAVAKIVTASNTLSR